MLTSFNIFTPIDLLLKAFGAFYILWFFFLAIMSLQGALKAGKLTMTAKVLAIPILVPGYLIDIAVNVIFGSILFAAPPMFRKRDMTGMTAWQKVNKSFSCIGDLTLSSRLNDYYNDDPNDTSYRKRIAVFLADNLVNPFDTVRVHVK